MEHNNTKHNNQWVILFYKYAPLSDDKEVMELYRSALEKLCNNLELKGRILVGVSRDAEGINGTLSGKDKLNVLSFTHALLGRSWCINNNISEIIDSREKENVLDTRKSTKKCRGEIIQEFWRDCQIFLDAAKLSSTPIPDSPEDFKWSCTSSSNTNSDESDLFPDLNIKLVKEIISTGGKLSSVPIDATSKDYLTPDEWHNEMKQFTNKEDQQKDTILIDCRNNKEYAIGHFENSLNPHTKTFAEFPAWVKQNESSMKDKKILMYCTGGIRCEKASAYIRRELNDISGTATVQHLKGGIHKYLDKYGADGYFKGKNFVFDRRVSADAVKSEDISKSGHITNEAKEPGGSVVGTCGYCKKKFDNFTAETVCTVCRELLLVCEDCRSKLNGEYHCPDHYHLKHCYFTNLSIFSEAELRTQLKDLEKLLDDIAVGRRYKQKRRTLHRQCDKIRKRLSDQGAKDEKITDTDDNKHSTEYKCRNCGIVGCPGTCWGFHGLARKDVLREKENTTVKAIITPPQRKSSNQRKSKILRKEKEIEEIKKLRLSLPPSHYRDPATSIRCPPPCIRVLETSVKGRWNGKSIASVLQSEFADLSDEKILSSLFEKSLISLNGIPVNKELALLKGTDANIAVSPDTLLKNMDVVSRVIHWHEPPVCVPESILVQKVELPQIVCEQLLPKSEEGITSEGRTIFCCDKPASVPVHPAGNFLSNSLTLMVEAQEGLEPRSLLPCHRLDRCTSGLTLCCHSREVAKLLQIQMDAQNISKLYLARVAGHFPTAKPELKDTSSKHASWGWNDKENYVEINAPIGLIDAANGIRAVTENGKPSRSRFKCLAYDDKSDTSLVSCFPLTGRGHQLRVHLQCLGFPIFNDVQYGGTNPASLDDSLKNQAIQAINDSIENETNESLENSDIDECLRKAAKEVCRTCTGKSGIEESFNDAQLLKCGHAIDLHALKYQIRFSSMRKKRKSCTDDVNEKEYIAKIDFETSRPEWINKFAEVEEINWLQ